MSSLPSRFLAWIACLGVLAACSEGVAPAQVECPPPAPAVVVERVPDGPAPRRAIEAPAPLQRCVPADGTLVRRALGELEALALAAEAAGDFERMLACAAEARRVAEDDAAAAHLQAEALLHLGRVEEAGRAFSVALALAPHDPWVLAGAAELHANHLPASRDGALVAHALAQRGIATAPRQATELHVQLRLISSWALGDLGDPAGALREAQAAARLAPGLRNVQVAQGRALYELTRFGEAAEVLQAVVDGHPDDAEAHHLLGLALERIEGRFGEAERHLALATALDPEGHPSPVPISDEELVELVRAEVAALPEPERTLLVRSQAPVHVAALPGVEDLRAVDPPLSPTAVGIFRGPPLGLEAPEPREIVLFARNLRRMARDREELRTQVRLTLLHEVGHLAGEDEADLRARGLD